MSTSVTYNGTTYAIPTAGELNWPNLTNFLVDVATSGAVTTKQVQTIRVAVTSPVTVGLTDCTVVTKLTVPAAVAVTLPAGVNGQTYIIHDGTGDAATNNVTITPTGSDTISGASTFVLNRSKGAVVLQYSTTGTDWKVLDLYIPPGQGLPADQKAMTASKVVVTDGSGLISPSTVTATELGYVSGVTSAIQTQLNAKQATGNYVTALTGDVTATGPGSVAATVAAVGGKTSTAVATSVNDTVAATNLNTNSTIVKRDGSGNFAAGTITAALTGNATTATTAGNVSGTVAIANGGTGQTAKTAAYDALNPNTTKGDLTARDTSANVRVAAGADGTVLTADAASTGGVKWTTPLTNPMNAVGDMIVGGSSGAATKLAIGASSTVLTGGTTPAWAQVTSSQIDSSVVSTTGSQTGSGRIKNKDLEASTTKIVDGTDTTKKLAFDLSGNSASAVTTLKPNSISAATLTLPAATTTLAGLATAQTFTATQTMNGQLTFSRTDVATTGTISPLTPTTPFIRLTGTGANITIRNITAGTDGQILYVFKQSGSNNLIVNFANAATSDIITRTGADVTLVGSGSFTFIYDGGASRWVLLSTNA